MTEEHRAEPFSDRERITFADERVDGVHGKSTRKDKRDLNKDGEKHIKKTRFGVLTFSCVIFLSQELIKVSVV